MKGMKRRRTTGCCRETATATEKGTKRQRNGIFSFKFYLVEFRNIMCFKMKKGIKFNLLPEFYRQNQTKSENNQSTKPVALCEPHQCSGGASYNPCDLHRCVSSLDETKLRQGRGIKLSERHDYFEIKMASMDTPPNRAFFSRQSMKYNNTAKPKQT